MKKEYGNFKSRSLGNQSKQWWRQLEPRRWLAMGRTSERASDGQQSTRHPDYRHTHLVD